jgi:SNF2 family DNA or RNA helicase
MYTLLSTGMEMEPTIKRAIVVCPTSLVKNWDDEIIKWLHGKVKTIALYGMVVFYLFSINFAYISGRGKQGCGYLWNIAVYRRQQASASEFSPSANYFLRGL